MIWCILLGHLGLEPPQTAIARTILGRLIILHTRVNLYNHIHRRHVRILSGHSDINSIRSHCLEYRWCLSGFGQITCYSTNLQFKTFQNSNYWPLYDHFAISILVGVRSPNPSHGHIDHSLELLRLRPQTFLEVGAFRVMLLVTCIRNILI